jgi:dienelactone hydrolase
LRSILITLVLSLGTAIASVQSQGVHGITVRASDGVDLVGTLFAPSAPGPGVVLFHMCDGMGREGWDALARKLMESGMFVLTVNYRGIGGSGGERFPQGLGIDRAVQYWETNWAGDTDSALDALIKTPGVDRKRLGVGGASCGVTMSLVAARRRLEIKTAVLLSGPYGEAAGAFIAGNRALPILTVASTEDSLAAIWMPALARMSPSPASRSVLYHGAGHGTEMLAREVQLMPTIVAWFRRHL